MGKKKIIVVLGPTASGKTNLAIQLAKKFNGELINADSRQIYKYLDIGTAKGNVREIRNSKLEIRNNLETRNSKNEILNKLVKRNSKLRNLEAWEIEEVPIHLINLVNPTQVLSLAEYKELAEIVIDDITSRGKLPILVGGTGLYVDAITKGYSIPKVEPDEGLRQQLNNATIEQLQGRLQEIDPEKWGRLNESDRANPRRLIRAIEVATSDISTAYSRLRGNDNERWAVNDDLEANNEQRAASGVYDVLFLSPKYEREELYNRINDRVLKMLEEGLLDEVAELIEKGYTFEVPSFSAIAYPLVKQFIEGTISKEELIDKWQQKERNYARRQETWFRRYKETRFVKNVEEAEKVVAEWTSS